MKYIVVLRTLSETYRRGQLMNDGQMVFSQLMAHGSRFVLDRCIRRYGGNERVRSFSCRDQYLAMAFAQLTYRESLWDIEACLAAVPERIGHAKGLRWQEARWLGEGRPVSRAAGGGRAGAARGEVG